jgi:hypothetical protein
VYRHGGEFSSFVGARIVAGIMQFIANGMMMTPNAPGNVIGRGRIAALNESFFVNLPTTAQKTKKIVGVLYEVWEMCAFAALNGFWLFTVCVGRHKCKVAGSHGVCGRSCSKSEQ